MEPNASLLRELHEHQAWADAQFWNALEDYPSAWRDDVFRKRQHHIHLVQHRFLWMVQDQSVPFAMKAVEDFDTPSSLKAYAREFHDKVEKLVCPLGAEYLLSYIPIPHFKGLRITVEQALTQTVMHSQHHRAQNMTRFRELGGTPPLIDFIAWLWNKKPAPHWT